MENCVLQALSSSWLWQYQSTKQGCSYPCHANITVNPYSTEMLSITYINSCAIMQCNLKSHHLIYQVNKNTGVAQNMKLTNMSVVWIKNCGENCYWAACRCSGHWADTTCAHTDGSIICMKLCHGQNVESMTSQQKFDSVNQWVFIGRTILPNFNMMPFDTMEP